MDRARWDIPVQTGTGLHARVLGSGHPTLVLLHGLAGSHVYFRPGFDRLSERATLVLPDLLGFGESPRPSQVDYGPQTHAQALIDLLHHLQVAPPVHFAAHSAGTLLALHIASHHPEWVQSLIAFGPPWYPGSDAGRRHLARLGFLVRQFGLDTPWAHLACLSICRHPALGKKLFQWLRPDLPPDVVRAALQHSWTSYSRTLCNLLLRDGVADEVASSPVPLHLVVGDMDPVVDRPFLESLARTFAHVRLDIWDGGHDLPLTRADACVELIEKHLACSALRFPGEPADPSRAQRIASTVVPSRFAYDSSVRCHAGRACARA